MAECSGVRSFRRRALILLALVTGCGGPADETSTGVVVSEDPDGVRVLSGTLESLARLPPWTIAPEPRFEIGTREGTPGHDLFGVQSAFVLSDGRLVIANGGSAELRFYTAEGEYSRGFGGQGEGPGEFVAIQRADPLPGDSILVFDSRARRWSLFDPEGEFVSDARVPGSDQPTFTISTGALASGRSVTLGARFQIDDSEMALRRDTTAAVLHERDGSTIDTLARLPGTELVLLQSEGLAVMVPRAFGRSEFARAAGATIVLATNDRYDLDILGADGAASARVRIAGPGCPTTEAEFDAWLEDSFGREPEEFRRTSRDLVSSASRHETHPAFQVIHIDRSGDVLVGRRACDAERMDYSVFSPVGLPIARFSLDADVTILDMGADYVVLRSRDQLDREIVRRHALERGPD